MVNCLQELHFKKLGRRFSCFFNKRYETQSHGGRAISPVFSKPVALDLL